MTGLFIGMTMSFKMGDQFAASVHMGKNLLDVCNVFM